MNEKILRQVEEMKKQTIGVEVEMNSITREKAASIAAQFFGTGRHEYTAGRNGYYTWSAWDAQGREWKFQRDVSISGPDSEKCELVTPILTYNDMELLQELIRRLRKAGAKSDASALTFGRIPSAPVEGNALATTGSEAGVVLARSTLILASVHEEKLVLDEEELYAADFERTLTID